MLHADIKRLFVWMTIFFIAMAFLESAVVVYLRALYYPQGFDFPLVPMDPSLVSTEVFRELATLVMLLAPGALVTRSALERFAWFCYGFGIWDIFYYVWLKVLLGWPSSLMTYDLLFLIPVPWVGPVWAPCVISLGLIALAVLILRGRSHRPSGLVDIPAWILLIAGALLMIISFTLDPLLQSFSMEALTDTSLMTRSDYIPTVHPWPWFVAGCALAIAGLTRIHRRGCPST
ncbi:MAG: hypothetical protein KF797_08030 [Flavobacteriales bacterium]|nr:hypothetical protein [Flavobacteriales bacterium]